jgi:hypothetical protein
MSSAPVNIAPERIRGYSMNASVRFADFGSEAGQSVLHPITLEDETTRLESVERAPLEGTITHGKSLSVMKKCPAFRQGSVIITASWLFCVGHSAWAAILGLNTASMDDWDLLQAYAQRGSETAFRQIVEVTPWN